MAVSPAAANQVEPARQYRVFLTRPKSVADRHDPLTVSYWPRYLTV
jgi:hypothetical protein